MAEVTQADIRDLRDTITAHLDRRCDRIDERLDRLNGTQGDHAARIAVLEDRGHPAAWGGGISGVVLGVVEAVRWMVGK